MQFTDKNLELSEIEKDSTVNLTDAQQSETQLRMIRS
jgi:hypothetical protein